MKDNSGDLDIQELKPLLRDLGIRSSSPRAEKLILDCDKDKSGTIDFGEFVNLIFRIKYGQAARRGQLRKVDAPKVERIRDDLTARVLKRQQKESAMYASEGDFSFDFDNLKLAQ